MVKNKIKSLILGALSLVLIAAPAAASAKSNESNSNAHNNVTICHATGSQTNPYVVITPNANGVVSGHLSHQDARDIIPAFDYNDHGATKSFAGQNWDTSGQAIFNNGCKVTSTEGGTDCDNDTDNSPASECLPGQGGGQMDCDNDFDNSPASDCEQVTGGQGGGQVLGASTTTATAAAVSATPVGGVNAGAGGGSALRLALN